MMGLLNRSLLRWPVETGLFALSALAMSCAGAPDEAPVALQESTLGGEHHSGGGGSTCTPRDTADTTCDGVDDDCDGVRDEDCAFGPANCPAGYHVITGTSNGDLLIGTSGRDCILGYGGNDVIFGLGGNDLLVGGQGDDFIAGGQGDDVIQGGAGEDQLIGGDGKDTIDGGDGNDVIDGADGADTIHGGACHDLIQGNSGSDALFGDSGSDRIRDGRSSHVDGGDGVDACDGAHCEVSSSSRFCTRDSDCSAGKRCVVATGVCVSPSAVAFKDLTCDGVDDDCDGKVDDDYVPVAVTCGTCGGMGMTSCVNGHVQSSCAPSNHASSDPTCDGVDDDCDGRVDEDFAGTTTSCGVGACAATGSTVCVAGHVQNGCTPGTPAASDASCDGVDNNCNGSVDEGYVAVTSHCGVGACASAGSTSCVGGHEQDSCAPGVPATSDATCNGVDDNCNGAIDEGYSSVIVICGVGACSRAGTTSCMGGMETNNCVPAAPAFNDASCNQVDDDCDGAIDEDFQMVVTTCGVGACVRNGATSCVTGVVHNSCMPGAPAASDTSCNGVDDDCNGATDEGYVSTGTTCGVGACSRSGNTSCAGGVVHDSCAPGTPAASDATCDGIDDNCNGSNDENYASVAVSCGQGACRSNGNTSCVGGAVQNNCTPGTPAASDVTCDGIDDNCNGTADEGFQPNCSGTTVNTCVNGQPHNTECADTNQCNGHETCASGACVAGTPLVTDDGNACTTDSCDPLMGVRHVAVTPGTSCEDGNVCNGAEQCLQSAGCLTPASGAVSWWPGDGNATDVIGGSDGVLTNGLGFTTGKVGQAFNFDGVDDVLDLSAHAGALNLAGQATLELWVRIPVDTCRTVFHLRQDSTHEQFLQVGNGCTSGLTNEIVTWTYNNGGTVSTPTSVVGFTTGTRTLLVDPARFHHLALTFDGHATAIYIDGVLRSVTTVAGTANVGIWGNFSSPTLANLGEGAGSPAQPFSGLMDEVTLYDHALTGTQIMAIFNAQTNGKCKAPTCTAGTPAPSGTSCGQGGSCDGAGVCGP